MGLPESLHLLFLVAFAERWAAVPEWPAYSVSTWGRVKTYWLRSGSHHTLRYTIGGNGKPVTPAVEPATGHYHLTLNDRASGRRPLTIKVSRLVLMAFDRMPNEGEEARHTTDPDPSVNCLWNLAWGTKTDNHRDRIRHAGRYASNSLSVDQVREIRRLLANGVTQKQAGEMFGVSKSAIQFLHAGKTHAMID